MATTPTECTLQCSLDLPECVDVLAAHPRHAALLAVCTYMLHPGGAKTGSVGLLQSTRTQGAHALAPACAPAATAAVFDGCWGGDASAPPLLLAATQGPALCLHAHEGGAAAPRLRALGSWALPCEGGVGAGSALSCAWLGSEGGSGAAGGAGGVRALASLADGRLWLGTLAREGSGGAAGAQAHTEACWHAHSLRGAPMEVWCAAPMAEGGGSVLWSGGDDGLLKGWDARAPCAQGAAPAFVARAHTAGVTCIAPRGAASPTTVATGCYDGVLRLWDSRAMAQPLAALDLGGGVWRVAWQAGGATGVLAAACMHGGARVVDVAGADSGGPAPRVLAAYTGHEPAALTYGVAWLGDSELASCAFYSKQVHAWGMAGMDQLARQS